MKKQRRFLWLSAALVLAVIIGSISLVYFGDRCPIRYENLTSIRKGMTMAEVERLLGCKEGNHATGPIDTKVTMPGGTDGWHEIPLEPAPWGLGGDQLSHIWHGDRGTIGVSFNEKGLVTRTDYEVGRRQQSTWWYAAERALGLER